MKFDFIENLNETRKRRDEAHIASICRELMNGRHIYDESVPHISVCEIECEGRKFCPTDAEIRLAMDEFKRRGWYGVYDREVHYYAVYKEEPSLGEWQAKYTTFLFRPSRAA